MPEKHKSDSQRNQERKVESKSSGSEKESLQAREYKDEKGETHHHTKKYMEQHEKK